MRTAKKYTPAVSGQPNRYFGFCGTCRKSVQAQAGVLIGQKGAWTVYCTTCRPGTGTPVALSATATVRAALLANKTVRASVLAVAVPLFYPVAPVSFVAPTGTPGANGTVTRSPANAAIGTNDGLSRPRPLTDFQKHSFRDRASSFSAKSPENKVKAEAYDVDVEFPATSGFFGEE